MTSKISGFDDKTIPLMAGISGCINVFFTILAVVYIDKLGRRRLLTFGAIIMTLSMLIIGIIMEAYEHQMIDPTTQETFVVVTNEDASHAIVVFVYIFVAGFAFSLGPTQWIYCAEIFPLTKRATGTSLTIAAHWAANCGVSFLIPMLLQEIRFGTYILFSILCFIISIFAFFFYPETKGVPLERMDELFRGPIFVYSYSNTQLIQNNTYENLET